MLAREITRKMRVPLELNLEDLCHHHHPQRSRQHPRGVRIRRVGG